jgi:hypothetical protein
MPARPLWTSLALASICFTLISALPTLRPLIASAHLSLACDCPRPDQCDENSCPGGCFSLRDHPCILAPAGTYARLTNTSASNVDVPCESGSYSPQPGATSCTACAAGTFAKKAASVSCDSCPVGTECPFAGMCLPFPCTAGTFSSTVGSTSTPPPPPLSLPPGV